MSEMIEKVERAIFSAMSVPGADTRSAAIAAIKAMREPTPQMIAEGNAQRKGSWTLTDCYDAMIDAALEGEGR